MRIVTNSDEATVLHARAAVTMFAMLGIGVSGAGLDLESSARDARLSEESIELLTVGDGFALDVPLVGGAVERVRVGRLGDDLVFELDGVLRLLALPPVLRRCRAVDASRSAHGLKVRFEPDPALWRSTSGGQS